MCHATSSMIPRLSPQSYFELDSHDEDVARFRKTARHLIGTTNQLAASGDYIATHVLGISMLIGRFDQQIPGFRHVRASPLPTGR